MGSALPSKDASNFRSALKLCESQQYKKALKTVEGVLKKNPKHGETLTLKGLIMTQMGNKQEGQQLIELGIECDKSSSLCWFLNGSFHKQERDYKTAAHCFSKALQVDAKAAIKSNPQITQDLAFMQAQLHNYSELVVLRKALLSSKPELRQNWTMLVIAQWKAGNLANAETAIDRYNDALKDTQPLPSVRKGKSDTELSELRLIKTQIIADRGDLDRAIKYLESVESQVLDSLACKELKARLLYAQGRLKEAQVVYRALIRRNPDNKAYYHGLQKSLEVTASHPRLVAALYRNLARKYPQADAPRYIPLEQLPLRSSELKEFAMDYVQHHLQRGTPCLFAQLKPLYTAKAALFDEIAAEIESKENNITDPAVAVWTWQFLAQHYCRRRDYTRALSIIDKAIQHTPTLVELLMTRARILKNQGQVRLASEQMENARSLDLQDRFVNTKCAKYLLRAGEINKAIDLVSLFTRNNPGQKGVKDYHEMQGSRFLLELAHAYRRQNRLGLALKRYTAVVKIFQCFDEDQYDFHSYAPRRATLRAYCDMLTWGESLYNNPLYIRAAECAIDAYLSCKMADLHAHEPATVYEQLTEKETDPLGLEMLAQDRYQAALELLRQLQAHVPETPSIPSLTFDIHAAQAKYALAAQALTSISPAFLQLCKAVVLKHRLDSDCQVPAVVKNVALLKLSKFSPALDQLVQAGDPVKFLDSSLPDKDTDALVWWAKTRLALGKVSDLREKLKLVLETGSSPQVREARELMTTACSPST